MKTKKNAFVLVFCGILAVCAAVVSATGAWFTDKATVSGTITMAKLNIDAKEIQANAATFTINNAVPGQEIATGVQVTATDVTIDCYLRVTVTCNIPGVTVGTPGDKFVLNDGTGGDGKYYYSTGSTGEVCANAKSALTASGGLTLWADGLTIADTTGNEAQGQTGTLTVTVEVVQAGGMSSAFGWSDVTTATV